MFADLRIEISGILFPGPARAGANGGSSGDLAQALLEDGELDPDIKQIIEREVSSGGIKVKVDPEYAHAQSIAVLSSLSCRLFCSGWLVLHNETDTPFITSDNPAPTIYLREGAYTDITYVPLTPKLALLTKRDPRTPEFRLEELDRYQRTQDEVASAKPEFVHLLNREMVRSAEMTILHSCRDQWLEVKPRGGSKITLCASRQVLVRLFSTGMRHAVLMSNHSLQARRL
ncbi:MAG: DUF4238 domain-containing protein [Gammaproteobacteria bacterium]|nr:DUF4238 domain-containing protein [Gammaproteobacteria bacterium]